MTDELACIVFKSVEGIRVYPPNLEIAKVIDESFDAYWKEGTAGIEACDYYTLVKIPDLICIESDQKSINVKRATAHLFRNLYCEGWKVVNSDVTSQDFANVLWVKKCPEKQMENMIAISLVKNDYMQLINMPQFMTDAVVAVVKSRFKPGISEIRNAGSGVVAVRLKQDPWVRGFTTNWGGLRVLTTLVQVIERQGYVFYAVLNYNGNSETYYFTRFIDRNVNLYKYTMFSFESQRQLEAFNLPETERENLKNMLLEHWLPDIESSDSEKDVFRLVLDEIPLAVKGDQALTTQKLVSKVFGLMNSAGFHVHFSVSNKVMFRFVPGTATPLSLAGLSIVGKDRFLLSNPYDSVVQVRNCILDFWPEGISSQKQLDNAHEFRIADPPADNELNELNVENFMHSLASLPDWELFGSVNIFSQNNPEKSCLNGVMLFSHKNPQKDNGFHDAEDLDSEEDEESVSP